MSEAAVLGSGNAACAYAAYLGKRGHKIHLYDSVRFESNLTPIKDYGGLDLIGADQGFGSVFKVTTDIEDAIKGIKVLFVVLPAFGHKSTAEALAPYVENGQIIVLNPGAVLGAAEFLHTLRDCGCTKDITMIELASNIFACRRTGPTVVDIFGKKAKLEAASIPADRIHHAIEELNVFFPDTFVPQENVLYTSLTYTNMIIHPVGSVLNMGRIEWTHGDFLFYWEGMTPGVCRNAACVDAERMAVGRALGTDLMSFPDVTRQYYGHPERTTMYEILSQSEVNDHAGVPSAPKDLSSRYITEDIPYALVPLSALGHALGVETPVIDALITLAGVANQTDYRRVGRTLESLGLEGLGRDRILECITTGRW